VDVARDYRVEIAHAAIDAGADLVMAHGTHRIEEIEVYKGKAIFYGLGNFFFQDSEQTVEGNPSPSTYHSRVLPGNLHKHPMAGSGLLVKADITGKSISSVSCKLLKAVSKTDKRPQVVCPPDDQALLDYITSMANARGTSLRTEGDTLVIA
jgi:poly-gamma-glutamate synthesis protein (capsule biosynthesis protein)